MKRSAHEYRQRGNSEKADELMKNYQDLSHKKKRISSLFKVIEEIRGDDWGRACINAIL
jgi:predicted transcriptional regulator YheO